MKRKNLLYEKTRIYKLLQKAFDKNFQSNQKKNGTAENARFSGDFCTEFFTDAKPAETKQKGGKRIFGLVTAVILCHNEKNLFWKGYV